MNPMNNENALCTTSGPLTLRTGQCQVLPMEIPPDFDDKIKTFSFSWEELRTVIDKESNHFAVKLGDGTIRVFTQACCFTIDLNSARAAVSLPESVWMMELATRTKDRDKAIADRQYMEVEVNQQRRFREALEDKLARCKAELAEAKRCCDLQVVELKESSEKLRRARRMWMKFVAKGRAAKSAASAKKRSKTINQA